MGTSVCGKILVKLNLGRCKCYSMRSEKIGEKGYINLRANLSWFLNLYKSSIKRFVKWSRSPWNYNFHGSDKWLYIIERLLNYTILQSNFGSPQSNDFYSTILSRAAKVGNNGFWTAGSLCGWKDNKRKKKKKKSIESISFFLRAWYFELVRLATSLMNL